MKIITTTPVAVAFAVLGLCSASQTKVTSDEQNALRKKWLNKESLSEYTIVGDEESSPADDVLDGVTFSRTITSLPDGTTFHLTLDDGHCDAQDDYGDNKCHYDWGDDIDASYELTMSMPLEEGDYFHGNFKIDRIVPYQFTCKLCGEDCVLHIPVIKEDKHFKMPGCPVPAHSVTHTISKTLRASSPTDGVRTHAEGTVTLFKANDDAFAEVHVEGYLK